MPVCEDQLTGVAATTYLTTNNLASLTLTHAQQWSLFAIIRDKKITEATGYFSDFASKNSYIRGLVIDLLWTGDFTTTTRAFLDPLITSNDISGLRTKMSDRSLWSSVSDDRFNRRKAYMDEAT